MDNESRGLISSRSEFHEALGDAFSELAGQTCRQVWLCDTDFADWPLNDAGVIDSLTRWAQPHRKMVVLAQHFDDVVRRHPRWVAWRRQWAHVVECRLVEPMEQGRMPVLLTAPGGITVKLVDPIRYRGSWSWAAADSRLAGELIDAVLQRSVEAFPATTLGL
jgi:hypothetical protein